MNRRKRVLITGINGFVGSHLARHLLHQGWEVVGVGRKPTPHSRIASCAIYYKTCDLADERSVQCLIESIGPLDAVVHLAGLSHIPHSWEQPSQSIQAQWLPALHLLESMRKHQRSTLPKIVLTGSAQEYGCGDRLEWCESDPPRPANPYGWGKWLQTELSRRYQEWFELPVVIIRPFNLIGPGMDRGVIIEWIRQAQRRAQTGDNSPLFVGNLEVVRDWLDVRDAACAVECLLHADTPSGDVWNLCSGRGVPLSHILHWIRHRSQGKWKVKVDPARIRISDPASIVGSNEKLRTFIPWSPTISLEQSLNDMWEAEQKHQAFERRASK
jgi:GDP-4-dehydro-6-deoxy-D-mannose reductase